MKKKSIVLGSLLAAVVLTGYSVSGTYAKYVSAVDLADEARVAKWEIGLSQGAGTDLNLFKDSYDYDGNRVVKSLTEKTLEDGTKVPTRVIAPGTKGQYTFALSGIIETNYKIQVTATGENKVVLTDEEGNVTYSPVRFYLAKEDNLDITTMDYEDLMDFEELKEALNDLYSGKDGKKVYAPGEVDKTAYTIYWTWNFEGNDDALDTQLGNEIVADETSHTLDLHLNITATQTREAATNDEETQTVVTPEVTDPETEEAKNDSDTEAEDNE